MGSTSSITHPVFRQKVKNDFLQAAGLLRHDLIWSSDFDAIREDLADFLSAQAVLGNTNHPALIRVVQQLISTENDLTI